MLVEPFYNTGSVSFVILEEDFRLRKEVYLTFPPKVNDSTTREAIEHFQVNIKNAVRHIDYICCYCNQFVDILQLERIFDKDAVFMTIFETNILYCWNLHVCGCCSRSFNFCYDC